MDWIVFYDIRSNRARTRVAKRLVAEGIRVQKSVFLLRASRSEAKRIARIIAEEVDPDCDSVCTWPLARNWQSVQHCFPTDATPLQETFVIA